MLPRGRSGLKINPSGVHFIITIYLLFIIYYLFNGLLWIAEMEESLKSNQLKNQRMEEVFHKYCSDFRRGIFHLFGYQVDCDEGNYKLTSVYSEDPQDFLSFKVLSVR